MDLKRRALITQLVGEMSAKGSWCGETHIQKGVFVGQELLGLPLDFDFILYKHGPFSFDLRDELARMQADGVLRDIVRPGPYGASLMPGELAKPLLAQFPKTRDKFSEKIRFVASALGDKGVNDLERIATALMITREKEGESTDSRARRLVELKPHISRSDALDAVRSVDGLIAAAKRLA
jgi:uncharacterized protein YwgA